jgi:hypothetical protein
MNDFTHLQMHNKKHQELIRKPKPSAMKTLFMQILTLATGS